MAHRLNQALHLFCEIFIGTQPGALVYVLYYLAVICLYSLAENVYILLAT